VYSIKSIRAKLNKRRIMSAMRATQIRRLPGFGLTLGFTLFYVTLMIVIPIAALLLKASSISMEELVETFKTPRVQASLRLTFGVTHRQELWVSTFLRGVSKLRSAHWEFSLR